MQLQTAAPAASNGQTRRAPELDALRGLLFVLMMLNHWPGAWKTWTDQPVGFISAAEGFVFLSAFMVGQVAERKRATGDWWRWWRARIGLLYALHVITILFAFTVFSVTLRPYAPYQCMFWGFNEYPMPALFSSFLLLYQPPLMDILPTYIVMLLLTPLFLKLARHLGLMPCILLSFCGWLLAWAGGRLWLTAALGRWCIVDMGAFDDFAWQFLWCIGLAASQKAAVLGRRPENPMIVWLCALLLLFFFSWRASYIPLSLDLGRWEWLTDKWRLGPLRLLNFFTLLGRVSAI